MKRHVFLSLICSPCLLLANPTGAHILSGEVAIQSNSANLLEIQTSDHAIIEWADFSIQNGETTRFIMPSQESVVLNRVCEAAPSHLLGRLESNGQLILINPSGVLVGRDAVIDVGSFVASTLDLQNDCFLAHKELKFAGESAAEIENYGVIRTDDAVLIGRQVHNAGSIEIPNGKAALLAGSEVVIRPNPSTPFYIRTQLPNDPFSAATMEGSIKAEGGSVYIMGDRIWLKNGSSIDVSSDLNAGTILIGGDYQGKNPDFQNAEFLVFEKDAQIFADSRLEGDGGKVILWADRSNIAYGSISAKGGMFKGSGGFAEISADSLVFEAPVDLSSSHGSAGLLYLDPTDILIAGATCGTVAIGPITTWTALCGCPVNISGAGIAAVLAGGTNVSINTATLPDLACGGGGSITVTSPINWGSVASLTLNASGNISITANIQNSGTGNVTVNSTNAAPGASVLIGPSLANVSVGSQNGITRIDAPDAALNVIAGTGRVAQIGFFTPLAGASAGSIEVVCDTLLLQGGGSTSGAQIGHGQSNVNGINFTTGPNANINVLAANGITLNSTAVIGVVANCNAWIGHGSRTFNAGILPAPNQAGDITVLCTGGDIILEHTGNLVSGGFCRIGHGSSGYTNGANNPAITGNINVRAPNGEIQLLSNISTGNNASMIGHGGLSAFGANSIVGDVYVACHGDLILDGIVPGLNTNQRVNIGAFYVSTNPAMTQNVTVVVGQDLNMRASQRTFIGSIFLSNPASYTGDVQVVVAGDIDMTSVNDEVLIGTNFAAVGAIAPFDCDVFVASGGAIDIDVSAPTFGTTIAGIRGGGNVIVTADSDITLTSGATATTGIGTSNRIAGGGATTLIHSGGAIEANFGTLATSRAVLGFDFNDLTPLSTYNVDIRARNDVQMAFSITGNNTTSAGFIFVEADCCLPVGDLWNYANGNLTSIGGFQMAVPITETALLSGVIATPSAAISSNGSGAFRVDTLPGDPSDNITFTTTSGNITVHSAPMSVDLNATQDLLIGLSPNNLNIVTASGNIDVGGSACLCQDGFNDISINTVNNPWTSGSIYCRAARDLNVNTIVRTNGAASPITLISDCNQLSGGDVNLNANVTTIGGALTINAGILDAGCTAGFCTRSTGTSASIIQGDGTVSSTTGPILLLAQNNFQLNPTTPTPLFCITSGSGTIDCYAGNDITIGANQDIQTAAAISFVAGHSMTLSDNATIQSTTSSVTIVVDDDFSSCPFNGARSSIGSLTTASTSSITGAPLMIFTALQSLNSINGLMNTVSFIPSTRYADTSSEVWCAFFRCPSSFSNCSGAAFATGLGNPFTIFYKDCLQQATQQAMIIVDQMLVSLHPFDEFPGWIAEFFLIYNDPRSPEFSFKDPYFIRRRQLNAVNQPKSWTALMNEGSPFE